jgi:prolyl 4-hydroxylase
MKIGIYGQRVATVLMYLNDVEEGGTTTFTELNITSPPVKGDAVIFYNCKPNGDPDLQTMHCGDAVLKGTKWLAIKLINQKGHGDAPKGSSSL